MNRLFYLSGGAPFEPYIAAGARYEFERPNDGQILAGDLHTTTPSAWSFSLETGVRVVLMDAVRVEASAGYLSIGQNNLDSWEAGLHVSFGFQHRRAAPARQQARHTRAWSYAGAPGFEPMS